MYKIVHGQDYLRPATRYDQRTGRIAHYTATNRAGDLIATHLDLEIAEKHVAKIKKCHRGVSPRILHEEAIN